MTTDTEMLDMIDEIIDNQEMTANVLSELLQRMTRMETRLCVLIENLGHGDTIASTRKGTV